MGRERDETNVSFDISAVFEVRLDGAKTGVLTLGATENQNLIQWKTLSETN